MRSAWIWGFSLAIVLSRACLAQPFEIGAVAGYAWDHDASIRSPSGSVDAGFKPGFVGGAVFGEDPYEYIGGEVRWLYRVGGPQLTAPGIKVSAGGYTNLVYYDLLVHLSRREKKVRPYIAGGAGVKVYTSRDTTVLGQPLQNFAVIAKGTEAEALISVGAGVQYDVHRRLRLRFDFHVYMAPAPDDLFRVPSLAAVHGWEYDFAPAVTVSYVF